MKNTIKFLGFLLLTILFVSCEEANQGDNANPVLNYGFKAQIANFDIPANAPSYELVVFATETSSVDRTISISKNETASHALSSGDVPTPPTSVVIPAGSLSGSVNVNFSLANLPIGTSRSIVFDLVTPADGVANLSATKLTINYTPECLDTKVQLVLNLDTYPEETGWNITKDGVVVASKAIGAYAGAANANTTKTESMCLASGNYTLNMVDDYGDGISGANPFTVKIVGGATLVTNVPFPGSSISRTFTIN